MTITLNGESREIPGEAPGLAGKELTLAALLDWLKIPQDRVAVERNLEIVPRARWAATRVAHGDRLEIVHFVGGG